jgi:hypothetical protein
MSEVNAGGWAASIPHVNASLPGINVVVCCSFEPVALLDRQVNEREPNPRR